jgi:hypothetical protein
MSSARRPGLRRAEVATRAAASPRLSRLSRGLLAHLAAYPIAFAWAVASIPLAIHLFVRDVDALHDDLPAIGQLITRRVAWPAGAAFVLAHLFALPWAFGARPEARAPWIGIASLAVAGVVFGAASWAWLLVR